MTPQILIVIVIVLITWFVVVPKYAPQYAPKEVAGKVMSYMPFSGSSSSDNVIMAVPSAGTTANEGSPMARTASTVAPGTVESSAIAENVNFYSNADIACQNICAAMDPCKGDLSYARNDFGGPGLDYKDWVTTQAIDPAVVVNHAQFIADRNKFGNVTGRTYSPDSHDSYNPIPWQGIRGRPQKVPVGNPDQVPDIDMDMYADEQRVTWKS